MALSAGVTEEILYRGFLVFVLAAGLPAIGICRITSYNVCYTKLLRKSFEELKLGCSFKADEMRDCSGMFLRLSEQLKERFPQVLAPQAQDARSSRDIASWYADLV